MAAAAADADALIAAAKKQPAPVYLVIGEPFQTEEVARALIDVLVPPEKRSFSLEQVDGRSTPVGPILDSLRMPSMFGGTKVIWVREPTLFIAGEKRGDLTDALFLAADEDRPMEAAETLLALTAMAGWTQDQFAAADWGGLGKGEATALFGRALEGREPEVLDAARALCRERGMQVGAFRDESGQLEAFLAAGVPPRSVLLFTTAAADRRKRVVKVIQQHGKVLELTVARERSGAISNDSVDALIDRAIAGRGARVTPAARALIRRRAGTSSGILAGELEKLCLYVGAGTDQPGRASLGEPRDQLAAGSASLALPAAPRGGEAVIDVADVREGMRDLAESWIFDFTKALAQRQAGAAVALLRDLFAQGEHPLRLLSVIARELRMLRLARDCLRGSLAGKFTARTTYTTFRDQLAPNLTEAEREALGDPHPYVLYQCLQNAGRTGAAALERGLLALQDLDVAFKSSAIDPKLRLEAFVLDFCQDHVRVPDDRTRRERLRMRA